MGARALKSKDLFPAIFSRHAAAYQARLDQIMARGEARGAIPPARAQRDELFGGLPHHALVNHLDAR